MQWPIVSVIAAVGIAALLGAWWLWWRLPKRQVNRLRLTIRDPKARADVEDNFRKTIGQLLGGAAVLIGAVLAYLQFSQQQLASHDLLISNQVSKGFEQLGSDKIVVRLGGIYALEGVMNTSEQYHQPVLEALSAFVRDGTRTEKGTGSPSTDIQAALTVIGRRKAIGIGIPDFANANIPKADLHGADLGGSNLTNTNLSGANLSGASLVSANLSGSNLSSTNLSGAILVSANLSGAILISANLSGASLSDAILSGASLVSANLSGANLSGANLSDANLSSTIFSGTILGRGANLSLLNSLILKNAILSGAEFHGANLSRADLLGANLSRADLRGAPAVSQDQLDKACGTKAELDPRPDA
jgi:uncharacterized protein YjbI with pentapeptide repeats